MVAGRVACEKEHEEWFFQQRIAKSNRYHWGERYRPGVEDEQKRDVSNLSRAAVERNLAAAAHWHWQS